MRVRIWPERKKGAAIRVFVLLGILVCVIVFTVQVKRFGGGEAYLSFASRIVGARLFSGALKHQSYRSPSEEDQCRYALSMLTQVKIARACLDFERERSFPPPAEAQLGTCGVDPILRVDPWGRPYSVRLLDRKTVVVQCFGRDGAGSNLSDSNQIRRLAKEQSLFLGARVVMVGDDLLVLAGGVDSGL